LFSEIDNIKVAVRKCLIAYKNKETTDYNETMKQMYVNMHQKMRSSSLQ